MSGFYHIYIMYRNGYKTYWNYYDDNNLNKNFTEISDAVNILNYCDGLQKLEFINCLLLQTDIKKLSAILRSNKTLRSITISCKYIGAPYMEDLLDVIRINKSLKILNLSNCGIKNHMMKNLADIITSNKTLEEIDLSKNEISNDGIYYIMRPLCFNRALIKLNLDENTICDNFYKLISDLINYNVKIRRITKFKKYKIQQFKNTQYWHILRLFKI